MILAMMKKGCAEVRRERQRIKGDIPPASQKGAERGGAGLGQCGDGVSAGSGRKGSTPKVATPASAQIAKKAG